MTVPGVPAPVVRPDVQSPGVTAPTPAPTTQAPVSPSKGTAESGEALATDRMIVRTGDMSIVVEDIPVAMDNIIQLAESYKGYVVNSMSWREGERLMGTITIRVPAGDFNRVLRLISEMAVEVKSQSTTSQDVSEEYVDLSANLSNLQATEQQLLRIMEKAEKVEDILAVQRELTATRSEIERTKGRMQYLERTSETSLVQVSLEQAKLDAEFNADTAVVKVREKVQFFGKIAGGFPPYSYEWNFGDGSTSTLTAPSHEYRASGSYTVTLTVTDDRRNSDTVTRKDYITVLSGWSVGNVARSAWSGLVSFGHGLAEILIRVIIFSPVWLVIGGLIYWWWRRYRKRLSSKWKSWFGEGK